MASWFIADRSSCHHILCRCSFCQTSLFVVGWLLGWQQQLAQARATANAQQAQDTAEQDAARLAAAEASAQAMMKNVQKETAAVEQAVQEFQKAQAALDQDFITKLRRGGPVKQASLVGLALFSVRSILDSLVALNDPSYLPVALIQGVIAIVCAAIFFLL